LLVNTRHSSHPLSLFYTVTYSSTQGDDPNAFIIPSRSEDPTRSQADEEQPPTEKKLSRSQQRKLRRVQEEKERRQQRALVMAKLSENQLKSEQLTLLRSVATKGQKESKKEALRRALQLERAGVIAGSDEKCSLYKERPQVDASDEQHSDRDELTSEDERFSPALPSPTILPRLENSNPKEPALKRQRLQSDRASAIPAVAMDKDGQKAVVEKIKRTELGLGIEMANAESDEDVLARKRTSPTARRLAPQVSVLRPKAFAESRANLPVVGMEQEIMEAINENDVIVLCGETGSGKTTQVPQFLYEAGYGCANYPDRAGMVGITQPRRVAAVSTASRVAEEMGVDLGKTVGYHIRHDRKAGPETVLKFMTDGLLLRELQDDFLLSKYSAIIVDEAHERSLNTDILLGMLSRIVKLRRSMSEESSNNIAPLKLVIMSATLRIEDFVNNGRLFSTPPPVVNVPARQYPVTVHFSRKTELHDYVGAAFKKTCQIHRNLPPGGVLVFLTGRQEVEQMCRMLRQTFRVDNSRADNKSLRSDDEIQESQMALGAQEDGVAGDDGGADAAEDVEAYLDQGPGLLGQLGKF
jgi:ATP-dependent RNA helicase DHX37/DHR1